MGHIIRSEHIDYDAIDLSWLIGRSIAGVTFNEPSFWCFVLGAQERLTVECLWRIANREGMCRTSEDHFQKYGLPAAIDAAQEATQLLSGTRISSVELRRPAADLVITFSNDRWLEVLAMYSGYAAWQLYGPAGVCYAAMGGRISTWRE